MNEKKVQPMDFCNIIPATFENSLTYLEQLNLLKDKINEMIDVINAGGGGGGGGGGTGKNGATFIPDVSTEGVISWTNDQQLPNPEPVNIKGKDGIDGTVGKDAVINGQNTLNILPGENIQIDQQGTDLTINSTGGGSGSSYVLPQATGEVLGGVKAYAYPSPNDNQNGEQGTDGPSSSFQPNPYINDVVIDNEGYLHANSYSTIMRANGGDLGGVRAYDKPPQSPDSSYQDPYINDVRIDEQGFLWANSSANIPKANGGSLGGVKAYYKGPEDSTHPNDVYIDDQGFLWAQESIPNIPIATENSNGIVRASSTSGKTTEYDAICVDDDSTRTPGRLSVRQATPDSPGIILASNKTSEDTQEVHVDYYGRLWTKPGGGGGSGGEIPLATSNTVGGIKVNTVNSGRPADYFDDIIYREDFPTTSEYSNYGKLLVKRAKPGVAGAIFINQAKTSEYNIPIAIDENGKLWAKGTA